MKTIINSHELNHLISYIQSGYKTFGNQKGKASVIFDELKNPGDLKITTKQTIIPFKKILFPDHYIHGTDFPKTAFIGLHACDLHALNRFYKEFKDNDLLPPRSKLLIVGTDCYPTADCFCDITGTNMPDFFDLFIQSEKFEKYSIYTGSALGEKIFAKMKFKAVKTADLEPMNQTGEEKIDFKLLEEIISDRAKEEELWQKLAENCFGCGACTAVCPLCFCTRQDFDNSLDGGCKQCLNWDSCFSKRFSEVQNRHDMRPTNTDRFYNWYHHKFVRAPFSNGHPLCTGCGRCITACPAQLNVKNIISTFIKKNSN